MTRRILLHVGTPKTGTSYLQDVLFRNRLALRRSGIAYPADRFDSHFLAALDLMSLPWGGLEEQAVGAWDQLVAQADDAIGAHTVVISHEILARASRAQVERALASLGGEEDAEIHVILSVRDLARQIPAEWQENVKHRATLGYGRFLDQIADPERRGRIASWFWGVQEVPDILDRWAGALPPERVHLITVPPPGADPTLLWRRFVEVFGLTGLDLDLGDGRANPSLGVPETALVRRINQEFNGRLAPADYRPLVREVLAHQTLSQRRDSARLSLPPDRLAWVGDLEDRWVDAVASRGYHVVGDLDDLRGAARATDRPDGTWADPDHPADAEVADAAVAAIGRLLVDGAHARHEIDHLHRELDDARRALERAHLRPSYRWREKVVRGLEESRAGRLLLAGYRRLRRR